MFLYKDDSKIISKIVLLVLYFALINCNCLTKASETETIWLDETLKPVYIEEDQLQPGEKMEIYCPLDKQKKYHIYLIGEWINFEDPVTDYDINLHAPSGEKINDATASAGLPEQISNDKDRQFYQPKYSGAYKFVIKNDERNSQEAESAIFMVLEHIELNKAYRAFFQGRTNTEDSYEGLIHYRCYEFNTNRTFFRVNVEVPKTLEMYEARLYRMSSPDKEIGLEVSNLGLPEWEFLEGDRTDSFGGFDYRHISNITREPELIADCDNYGEDMFIDIGDEEDRQEGDEIFYYLVLLAEFGQGEVNLYVKDEVSKPQIDLIEPAGDMVFDEKNQFNVSIESDRKIEEAWVEYSNDNWRTTEELQLEKEQGYWICELPEFGLNDRVHYQINAKDVLGNIGSLSDSKEVKKGVEINIELSAKSIKANENIEIEGRTSLNNPMIELCFTSEGDSIKKEVKASSGSFSYDFTPTRLGTWSVNARYEGDAEYGEAKTKDHEFTVNPSPLSLSVKAVREEVPTDGKIVIEGSTDPPINGASMKITYSGLNYTQEYVTTDQTGSFTSTYKTRNPGVCQILVELTGEWKYGKVQSDLITVKVHKKNPIELILHLAGNITKPPLLYGLIGSTVLLLIIILYRIRTRF